MWFQTTIFSLFTYTKRPFQLLLMRCLLSTNIQRRSGILYLSKTEVIEERKELLAIINKEAFFPLSSWWGSLRLALWKKPIHDRDTFKLMLFWLGNGWSPPLITRWTLLSQTWAPEKVEKSALQIDFVLDNAETKRGSWFMVLL